MCTVLAQQRGDRPLQVGLLPIGCREAVPLVEWNADHPPASRPEEAPLEQRWPIGFAHAPAVGQQEVRGAVHLDRDARRGQRQVERVAGAQLEMLLLEAGADGGNAGKGTPSAATGRVALPAWHATDHLSRVLAALAARAALRSFSGGCSLLEEARYV